MDNLVCYRFPYPLRYWNYAARLTNRTVLAAAGDNKRKTKLPKNLRYPRREKFPLDFHPILYNVEGTPENPLNDSQFSSSGSDYNENDNAVDDDGNIIWSSDEIEAISSLFQGRVPQKPGKLQRERPLPLPLPHKIRPLKLPTQKQLIRTQNAASERQSVTNHIYKNPTFLIGLAREIKSLPETENVSNVLDQWSQFLRKGSLSLTVRELGHMGVPDRALHVFCWVEKQSHLFPDDRILASSIEVLARAHELKMPFDLKKFICLASRSVYEAMVKGCIKGGNLRLAYELVMSATHNKRMLDPGVYAKLILKLGRNPDKKMLILPLLEELSKREDLLLTQQDCTAVMKVCVEMGRFEVVESFYHWFKNSGRNPSVVMYTTLLHSRYLENKYKDAMLLVWEMEGSNCPFDLPAYRVLIKLFVAMNDLSRTSRYFSKLKESGFAPTYDIYRDVIGTYMTSGRFGKCREILQEAEKAGFKWGEQTRLQLL